MDWLLKRLQLWLLVMACRLLWTGTYPTSIIFSWQDEWKSAAVVNSSLVDDPSIWQPGFDLPICYWALQNLFWINQSHCASCQKKWGLAATDMCPCGKHQTMSHIVNSCPQLERAAAIALSWWRCYQMAKDVNALDKNNNSGMAALWHAWALSPSSIIWYWSTDSDAV